MMFENNNSICPVSLLRTYISKRPLSLQSSGPLYLTPIDGCPSSSVWFKKTPLGVNALSNIVKNMINSSPLAKTITKKVTNHSARKTLVKKLKSNGVPKADIITITGHTTTNGLDDYDSGDEQHQEELSKLIDIASENPVVEPPPKTSNRSPLIPIISPTDPRVMNPSFQFFPRDQFPISLNQTNNFVANNHQQEPVAQIQQQQLPPQPQQPPYYCPPLLQPTTPTTVHHFHMYSGSVVNMSSGPTSQGTSPTPISRKRYKRIVDSSDEED